jgi:hypothetical protein
VFNLKFVSEYEALKRVADIFKDGAVAVFGSVRCIYSACDSAPAYPIEELVRLVTENYDNPAILGLAGFRESEALPGIEFDRLREILLAAFAARIAALKKTTQLDDKQIAKIFVIVDGTVRYRIKDIYIGTFDDYRKLVRQPFIKSLTDMTELFDCAWIEDYLKLHYSVLGQRSNANLLFFGAVEMLFEGMILKVFDEVEKFLGGL